MQRSRLWSVAIFALAMAYVEAAVVVYLRRVYGIVDLARDVVPYQPFLAATEVAREAATLVMLLAVGWAAGRSLQARLGLASLAFGLWDIFYYAWLKTLLGWPASLLAPDILFLIPVPWWGPVLAPVLIAALAVTGGALAVVADSRGRKVRLRALEGTALGVGMLAALYTFMVDALAALPASAEALSRLRPSPFNWPVFLSGLAMMGWAVWRATWGPALCAPRHFPGSSSGSGGGASQGQVRRGSFPAVQSQKSTGFLRCGATALSERRAGRLAPPS